MAEATKRYAVVTGANKGIGLEICKQLASQGVTVVLTSRDEKKGMEAVEKLKETCLSEYIVGRRTPQKKYFAPYIIVYSGNTDLVILSTTYCMEERWIHQNINLMMKTNPLGLNFSVALIFEVNFQ
ncbi:hypothetical protein SLA2020_334390 [Shorea laevis]